jgi:hypothetical protein
MLIIIIDYSYVFYLNNLCGGTAYKKSVTHGIDCQFTEF